jgi:C-terminal processing protease CtpA/Prc
LGARSPIYALPAGFVVRLGTQPAHFFFSGSFLADGVRIGLLRIPSMSPPNTALALQQLDQEIAFFNANTDVLIVDVMRNLGGFVQFSEAVSQRLIPTPFQTVGFEIRATANWVTVFASRITNAQLSGAPPEIIQNLRNNFDEVLSAYNEERGRSAPISLNATGSLTLAPVSGAYTKPVLVLVDEFSASSADMFAAIIQDNRRGPIFGMRTMGAGGSVVSNFDCAAFTESLCAITVSLMNRGTVVSTPEFPPAPYIENIGVRPDIVVDYMTRANLVGAGVPFVQAFTQAAVTLAHVP